MARQNFRRNRRIILYDAEFVSYSRPDFAHRMQIASKDGMFYLEPSQISRVLGISELAFNSKMKEVLSDLGEDKDSFSAYFKILKYENKPFTERFFSTSIIVKVGSHFDTPEFHHFCKWLADKSFFAMPDELDHSKFKFPKRA